MSTVERREERRNQENALRYRPAFFVKDTKLALLCSGISCINSLIIVVEKMTSFLVPLSLFALAVVARPQLNLDDRTLSLMSTTLASHTTSRFVARPLRSMPAALAPPSASTTPVVLMHGLGDAGSNAGMASLAQSVETAYPGAYAVAVNVANGVFSFIVPISDQIDELAAAIKADPKLSSAPEINLVGLSQGGLIVRGYVERYAGRNGYPRVKNLVSICGVQNGVFNCPLELQIIPFLCDIFESDPYDFLFNGSIPLSFSDCE